MFIRFILFFAFFLPLTAAFCQAVDWPERYPIIPYPAHLEPIRGEFILSHSTTIFVPAGQADLKAVVDTFTHRINRGGSGLTLSVQTVKHRSNDLTLPGNLIQFIPSPDTTLGNEGYRILVLPEVGSITIEAAHTNGFFYAVQTLYQLLPPSVLAAHHSVLNSGLVSLNIPACRIEDRPRYPYRGMNLDVSRHFFSVVFIKKYLDLMALHKFNAFHWHLTDDQGWRIEIKKYPKLTKIGSHRRETMVGHYDDSDPQVFDGKPYGGFYTQNEIREVVRYAATKYITVIPEIELPGHAMAALAAYPDLGCLPRSVKGETYQVATKWGVFDDVLCPTEKTFTLLENVLTEVMDLFPGQYIHIGGDECPKTVWRKNAFCQQLIKHQGLKNERELQRYFISRIDKFVAAKGRRIIGWDEILEGDSPKFRLSPKATVMSWRSIKNGIEAARQHHDVIMTPGKFCYLDHYQGDPAQEPTAFGGFLPLATVYSYNPTPAELSATEAGHILGTQGNVWTEYIKTPDQVEYMIWPRAAALAEVAWTSLPQKNYDHFVRRLPTHFERLANLNVNYSRTLYDALPSAKPMPDGKVEVTLSTSSYVAEIRYTLDGRIPSGESLLYENPFVLERSATVRTATFENGKPLSQLAKVKKEYIVSKATGKPYTLLNAPINSRPDKNYSLTDGTTGSIGGYEVAKVASFTNDLNAVVDLGVSQPVESVRIGFLKYTAKNMCLPRQVEISVSEDGKSFRTVLTAKTNAAESGRRAITRLPFDFTATTARYVRIIARNAGQVPTGLRTPGKAAKLAVDEIEVR